MRFSDASETFLTLGGDAVFPGGSGSNIITSGECSVRIGVRECVRNLDLRVQVHPGELWFSKQRVHIVLEASKSAGAKGDVPKICGFVHPLHPC